MGVVYGLLALGAVTTIYPFLLMISTGFKGPTDQNDNKMIPAFWQDQSQLLAKYRDDKYAGDASLIASTANESGKAEDIVRYEKFLQNLPSEYWMAGFRTAPNQMTGRLQILYQAWLRSKFRSVDDLNRKYIEENVDFQTCVPPNELLERKSWKSLNTEKYRDWLEFKKSLPIEFRIPVRETRMYQEFVRAEFQNNFSTVPEIVANGATKFEELRMSAGPLAEKFRANSLPSRYLHISAEGLWLKHWMSDSTSNTTLARVAGHAVPSMPILAMEARTVSAGSTEIKRELSWRNYGYVLDYILLNGNALLNTLIFCSLAILVQLTINPIAAYALSRYPIKQSGKILIFLLATMAFPAEVAMIPSFLLLKDLHLLNTFAALVLPTAASGYMIFLLKGFIDSLPQELFEAGQLDGAKESTMMMRIALPLSRPVLGYLALIAFMSSYSAFIHAFLVAQDQRMWTLMVFIYQLQTTAPKAVMMAALTLAAIPTLIVFLFAQRVIMRGIVLPGER
jgi:multiple sugar transport system permease protein